MHVPVRPILKPDFRVLVAYNIADLHPKIVSSILL